MPAAGLRAGMDLLIVGAGEMGRWVGHTVSPVADVSFADRDRAVATAAAETVGGRAVALDGPERFEAVCVAVPMGDAPNAVATHADRAAAAVLDVAGVMAPVLAAMREAAPELERVSAHPLFAPANAPGRVAVVRDDPGPVTDELLEALSAAGNEVFETTAAEHDEAMETVQARAHAAVLAYALAAEDVDERFHTPLSGTLSELVATMRDGDNDARVYADVQATFDGADAVAAAARRVAEADPETVAELIDEGR